MNYNGYKNYQTWNVILWISSDPYLYSTAAELPDYDAFKSYLMDIYCGDALAYQTPDGVAWNDSGLDANAIDSFWKETFSKVSS